MTDKEKVTKEILKRAHQPHSHEVQHIRPREISGTCGVALRFVHEVFFQIADERMIDLTAWNTAMDREIPYNEWPSMDEFFYDSGDKTYVRVKLLLNGLEVLQLDKHQPIGFAAS
jgi:hypothetical protein